MPCSPRRCTTTSSPASAPALHAAYARALQEGRASGTAAELARHARLAKDYATALTASLRAGDDARGVGGAEEAAFHYLQALELWHDSRAPEGSHLDYPRLVGLVSDALIAAGHPARALGVVREQLDHLPPDTSDSVRGQLLGVLAGALAHDRDAGRPDRADPRGRRPGARRADDRPGQGARRARPHAGRAPTRSRRAARSRWRRWRMAERLDMPRLASDIRTTLVGLERQRLTRGASSRPCAPRSTRRRPRAPPTPSCAACSCWATTTSTAASSPWPTRPSSEATRPGPGRRHALGALRRRGALEPRGVAEAPGPLGRGAARARPRPRVAPADLPRAPHRDPGRDPGGARRARARRPGAGPPRVLAAGGAGRDHRRLGRARAPRAGRRPGGRARDVPPDRRDPDRHLAPALPGARPAGHHHARRLRHRRRPPQRNRAGRRRRRRRARSSPTPVA